MKRWAWILGSILTLLFFSGAGTRLEELKPVVLLSVRQDRGNIILETDGGDLGIGSTVQKAAEDLYASGNQRIFLETAEYLILEEGGEETLPGLYPLLRPAVQVCRGAGNLSPETAVLYLRTHPPGKTLLDVRRGEEILPLLTSRDGRYLLVGAEMDR